MLSFHIQNFGCRATQADAAAIEAQLREGGFARAETACADLVVINTCTVTADADAAARQAIRAAHRANPAARIVVTGCYAQRAPEELADIKGVSWVIGNSHQQEIAQLVGAGLAPSHKGEFVAQALLPAQGVRSDEPRAGASLIQIQKARPGVDVPPEVLAGNIFERRDVLLGPASADSEHTRPVLRIQDGCNNRCSYCVIPFVRGRSRSLPPARVVEEVIRLCATGAKEIVLSGINLGAYGRDLAPRASLVDVLRRMLDETPLERLRLSSVEPQDITQELVDLVATNSSPEGGRLARHFHVPLQSGSDRILAAMHRWYRAEHYARRIELIRDRIPGAAIGADVIVGFPGETDEDHAATRSLIERLPFTYLHVFAFSKRPGTAAYAMLRNERSGGLQPGTGRWEVPAHVIKHRSRELRALAAQKSVAFRRAQLGSKLRAITLQTQRNGSTHALSDNYLTLHVTGSIPHSQFVDLFVENKL
jgi:threonylcarbamoyladenosine tRNA methylthiotransferase MtaB